MTDQPPAQRTKANSVGMKILFVIASVGILSILFSIYRMTNYAADSANDAAGVLYIVGLLGLLVIVPLTSISLFFAVVLALNLKIPENRASLPIENIKSYTNKLTKTGVGGILLGAVLVLFFTFSNDLGGDTISITFVAGALIPVTIMIFIWSFIYLFRAHMTLAIITAKAKQPPTNETVKVIVPDVPIAAARPTDDQKF